MTAARRRRNRTAPLPRGVALASGLVAVFAALPLLYVLVRAAGAGGETWSLLLGRRIPVLLLHTAGLAVVVCAGTLLIGAGSRGSPCAPTCPGAAGSGCCARCRSRCRRTSER
jgi:hypothetical protein